MGAGVRTVKGLDNLTSFGTPKDVVQQTKFGDGSTKVGTDRRTARRPEGIYAKGKYFSRTDADQLAGAAAREPACAQPIEDWSMRCPNSLDATKFAGMSRAGGDVSTPGQSSANR